MSAATLTKTPTLSGVRVAHDMLVDGLTSFTKIADAVPESDIVRWRSGHRHVFAIKHPDYIEHVLRKHADRYMKSVEYQLVSTVLGRSLFTDDGESWRRHRMMLNPLLGRRHLNAVVDLMIDPIDDYVLRLEAQGDRFEVESAGTDPSHVRPEAIRVMAEIGIDISSHRSKSVDEFAGQKFDFVITVCDNAKESCPIFPGETDRIHWSFDDPAAVEGTEEVRLAAFRTIRDQIEERLVRFASAAGREA